MLRECEGDGNTGMVVGGGVVPGCVYMGGTHGSGIVSSADDLLEMSSSCGEKCRWTV